MSLDQAVTPAIELSEFEEIDIACDIYALRQKHEAAGYPPCKGDPARWVAWRANCCPEGPRYRLVCDHCKRVYQNWMAKWARIVCVHCHQETGGYCDFTPLRGRS